MKKIIFAMITVLLFAGSVWGKDWKFQGIERISNIDGSCYTCKEWRAANCPNEKVIKEPDTAIKSITWNPDKPLTSYDYRAIRDILENNKKFQKEPECHWEYKSKKYCIESNPYNFYAREGIKVYPDSNYSIIMRIGQTLKDNAEWDLMYWDSYSSGTTAYSEYGIEVFFKRKVCE